MFKKALLSAFNFPKSDWVFNDIALHSQFTKR